MDIKDKLTGMLEAVPDSYKDFVSGIINSLDTEEMQEELIAYMESHPDADTSKIIIYVDDVLNPC